MRNPSLPLAATVPVCPGCNATALTDLGAIRPASLFAGHPLEAPLAGGRLHRCPSCDLVFRFPRHPPALYDQLYAQASTAAWADPTQRQDQLAIAGALSRLAPAGGDVLDIGCGAGLLLGSLPPRYRRFGVEIGAEAREQARARQIELVAENFAQLDDITQRFDAVIACDVIEHHPDPSAFLRQGLALLKPGGLMLISTGDNRAPLWRRVGSDFWYCHNPEHISFISEPWVQRAVPSDAELAQTERFRYRELSLAGRLKQCVLLAMFHLSPALYSWHFGRRRQWDRKAPYFAGPPGLGLTRDHLLVVIRKR